MLLLTLRALSSVIFDRQRVPSRLCKWRTRGGVVAQYVTRLARSLSGCDAAHFRRDAVGIHKTLARPTRLSVSRSSFPHDFEIRIEK